MFPMLNIIKSAFYLAVGVTVVVLILQLAGVLGTIASAPGRVVNDTLQTDNIITSYEWFHDANAQFIARVSQVKAHGALIATSPEANERTRLRIELAAIQQSCRELATKYNANSTKANKSLFKGSSVPVTLSITECE